MKMYVLTRRDLSIPQQAVQAGHAVAELILRGPPLGWDGTLIYLGVENEEMLSIWCSKLDVRQKSYIKFREPDIGNQLTAIACLDDGKIFSRLKLL
jgi:hypothetical protein